MKKINGKKVRQIIENYSKVFPSIDWNDPENLVVFHQCIYRLFALFNQKFHVLHASATVSPNNTVIALEMIKYNQTP